MVICSALTIGCRIFCRDILVNEGIWDMVRVDHGTEACLMLFIQDYLGNHRGNVNCPSYVQTRSREVIIYRNVND